MKKLNLEATDENILDSISKDVLKRTQDILSFIQVLETIDYNAFISLDAAWGEGKTFFVRQVEMTLRYHNSTVFKKDITEYEQIAFNTNNALGGLQLKKTYFPIYFDAWLYDNHSNALMALLLVMIKQCGKSIDSIIPPEKGDILATILDSITFWNCNSWTNLREAMKGKDILSEVKFLEEIRHLIKRIFDEIIVENGQKLVIFIDELDRCKPTFAVEMLESIKHYFEDERIIFVMSVNKSQLIHTISNYYGEGFDSSGYLNKFFDVPLDLPIVDTTYYFQDLIVCGGGGSLRAFANELQKKYRLSIRDTAIYFQKIERIAKRIQGRYSSGTGFMFTILLPILCLFEIKDVSKKKSILEGKGFNIIEDIIRESEIIEKYALNMIRKTNATGNYDDAIDEIKKAYDYICSERDDGMWYQGFFELYPNFMKECIQICNTI